MAQGIKNRKIGDIFIDEGNKQIIYTLTKLEIFNGEFSSINSDVLNLIENETFEVANKVNIKKTDRVKSAVLVQLTRNKTKQEYNLVRYFDKEINSKSDIPTWGGLSLRDDFDLRFGIKPRLKSAIAGQALYQPSKFDFSELFADTKSIVETDRFQDPDKIYNVLLKKAKGDRTKFGLVILKILLGLKNNNSITIPDGLRFLKEINIYVSEFIVPLMIAMNKTSIMFDKPMLNIASKANQIGYDAEIKDLTSGKSYLVSVKQGGSRSKHGAYGSIAFIAKILSEKRSVLEKRISNFDLFEKLLGILLGNSSSEEDEKNIILSLTKRKTYKNLIAVASKLGIDNSQIDTITTQLSSPSFNFEQKIELLNKFALNVYSKLNENKWFKETTKTILQLVNFIQAKLLITSNKNGDLQILGVEVNTLDENEIDFSAKKSYFGNKLATGHGGFLLKEIEKETLES